MTPSRPSRSFSLVAGFALALSLLVGGPALAQDESAVDDEIRDLAEAIAFADEARFAWNDAVRLAKHRDKAVTFAVAAAKDPDATAIGRVALARVLVQVGERGRAAELLMDVARGDAPVAVRTEAVRLLEEAADEDYEDDLFQMLEEALDPRLRAALAKSLWVLTRDIDAKTKLKDLLRSDDLDLRVYGAIGLAEVGDFNEHVRAVLQEIRYEPTPRGRLAHALLSAGEWQEIASAGSMRSGETTDGSEPDPLEALIQDAMHRLKSVYVNPEDLDTNKLWQGAAKGLVDAVGDPYTTFQSAEDRESWTDLLTKEYGGIGAYVGYDKEGFFIVTRPMYGGPAWKARLQSGDRVITVDGWSTGGQELNDIVDRLRGTPDTPVEIEIQKRGWQRPRKMSLTRGFIKVPTVHSELLPGGVGYVNVDNFAKNTSDEFRKALRELERRGATSLVLDLRWNSGGYLRTAQELGDYLLPPGKLVVETAGRAGTQADAPYISKGQSSKWSRSVPLRVLINGSSASASEILSGALKVHGRARVIGLRSYGKGSVQNLYPLYTQPFAEAFDDRNKNGAWDSAEPFDDRNDNGVRDGNERYLDLDRNGRWSRAEPFEDRNKNEQYDSPALKITIAKYYVGAKVGAHEINPHRKEMVIAGRREFLGGIEPDAPVEGDALDGWRAEEIARLQEGEVFDKYLREKLETDKDQMLKLAVLDTRNPDDYPDFDAFYGSLDTKLSRQDVWYWLHVQLRNQASDTLGRPLVGDWAVDAQLQRALRDLMDDTSDGADVRDVPEYAFIREREFEIPPTYDPEALSKARPLKTR